MALLALLLLGSGIGLAWADITGRNPLGVLAASIGSGNMPAANTWLPITQNVTNVGDVANAAINTYNNIVTGGANPSALGTVVQAAMSQRGKPYVWDTPTNVNDPDPKSFDCSGLTMWAYAKIGVHLAHYTVSQEQAGRPITLDQALPGDLIFTGIDSQHVVMWIGNGQVVHAPHTGSVVKTDNLSDVFKLSSIQVRRYVNVGTGPVKAQ